MSILIPSFAYNSDGLRFNLNLLVVILVHHSNKSILYSLISHKYTIFVGNVCCSSFSSDQPKHVKVMPLLKEICLPMKKKKYKNGNTTSI